MAACILYVRLLLVFFFWVLFKQLNYGISLLIMFCSLRRIFCPEAAVLVTVICSC